MLTGGSGRIIRIALAGNPNSGKTTIFNALTGSHQTVGNWPGVTVEKKEGRFEYLGHAVTVVDLPGTYSLSVYSLDEQVAHNYLIDEAPDGVVAIADASNLERNLYLVLQLLELGAKVVLDLNMSDIAQGRGIEIDAAVLQKVLGVRVVTTTASKGTGIVELKRELHDLVRLPASGFKLDYGDDLEPELERLATLVRADAKRAGLQPRWLVLRLMEGEQEELHHVAPGAEQQIRAAVEETKGRLQEHWGRDIGTFIAERRFGFIKGLVRECTQRPPAQSEQPTGSDRIDRVLTNRWSGVPIFLLMMGAAFQLVFRIGTPLARVIDAGFAVLERAALTGLLAIHAPGWIGSLLADGVIHGVGSVLIFLPNIGILFLVLALLEDSGYMARAAFVMDRFMHALGLHGKSFIPMMMGFGCCVPAILATRALESRKDRIITILITPLMSCSARLPIYTLLAAAFFPRQQGLVVFSLYLLGIVLAVVMARLLRTFLFREEAGPLIIELPPYHLPVLKHLLRHVVLRSWLFVRKAGTIIAGAVVVLWILARLPWGEAYASQATAIGRLGTLLAPIFRPAGFGHWQVAVSLLAGVVAKELVVGTLGTLSATTGRTLVSSLTVFFNPVSAYAFMAMSLIYTPCVATIAAIRRETNWRWAALAVGYSLMLGWLVAVGINQVGTALVTRFLR